MQESYSAQSYSPYRLDQRGGAVQHEAHLCASSIRLRSISCLARRFLMALLCTSGQCSGWGPRKCWRLVHTAQMRMEQTQHSAEAGRLHISQVATSWLLAFS